MTKYHGQLFADAQFCGKTLDIIFADGETQKDLMPLLLEKGFDYLFKTRIYSYSNTTYIVNGIEYSKSGILYLDEVLVETLFIKKVTDLRVQIQVDYCL